MRCVSAFVCAISVVSWVSADVQIWLGGDGPWSSAGRWSAGGSPGADDTPIITNGGVVTLDRDAEVASLAIAYAGPLIDPVLGSGAGTLRHTDGRLNVRAGRVVIGGDPAGQGRYQGSGFAWFNARDAIVDFGAAASGGLSLSTGAIFDAGGIRMPWNAGENPAGSASGYMTLSGQGTRLRISRPASGTSVDADPRLGLIELGRGGRARARVYDGALLQADRLALWAMQDSTHSELHLEGANSTIRTGLSRRLEGDFIAGIPPDYPHYAPLPEPAEIIVEEGTRIESISASLQHVTLRGSGTIRANRVNIYPGVRIEPSGPEDEHEDIGTLNLHADVFLQCNRQDCYASSMFADRDLPRPVLEVEINWVESHDQLVLGGNIGFDLEVDYNDDAALGTSYHIVHNVGYAVEQGRFSRIMTYGTLSKGVVLRPRYRISGDDAGAELVVTHPADVNIDGSVTLDDIDAFVASFLHLSYSDDPVLADINQDGELNFDDIDLFVEAYLAPN